MLLSVEGLTVSYGRLRALRDVSFEVGEGECTAVLGPNGAGKSTLLRAISGIVGVESGRIVFDGRVISGRPAWAISRLGIAHVQEGRGIFPRLTVEENLRAVTARAGTGELTRVLGYFPRLGERQPQMAGTLSGGEQQMLALSLALLSRPRLLLVDEPSLGLAPLVVKELYDVFARLRDAGTTLVIVEQFVNMVLRVVDRGHVLQKGQVASSGSAADLTGGGGQLATGELAGLYLGAGEKRPVPTGAGRSRRRALRGEEPVTLTLPSASLRWLEEQASSSGRSMQHVLASAVAAQMEEEHEQGGEGNGGGRR